MGTGKYLYLLPKAEANSYICSSCVYAYACVADVFVRELASTRPSCNSVTSYLSFLSHKLTISSPSVSSNISAQDS